MGKILQIRVMAYTYDEGDVTKAWPKLSALAFPARYPAPQVSPQKGVLELIDSLVDQIRFDMVDKSVKQALGAGADAIKDLKAQLEEALANWNPQKANKLSDDLEQMLDELEKETPAP